MHSRFAVALALALASVLPVHSSKTRKEQDAPAPTRLVHISFINMSGTRREARIRYREIELPIARQVALQLPAGQAVQIFSDTDQHVSRIIVVRQADEGRLFPIE